MNNSAPSRQPKLDNEELLSWAVRRVKECQQEKFYGKLTIHFESGKIVRTTSEKSEVPS